MCYAELPADEVFAACDRYRFARQKRIADKQEAMIQAEMKKKGFFSRKYKTYEESKAYLESADRCHPYRMLYIEGGLEYNKVMDLKALAYIAGDKTVQVSAELAHILMNYFR